MTDAPHSTPAAASEPLPDREQHNPALRWLMHLGVPMTISLLLHVALLIFLALKTFSIFQRETLDVGDYRAGLTQSLADQMSAAFQWGNQELLQALEQRPTTPLEDLMDLSDLRQLDTAAITPTDIGKSGGSDDGFGLGEGRLSLLGTGTGAGAAGAGGFGSGLGGGSSRLLRAGVWDLSVAASKIVYVVDFSGSIVVAVDDLKRELRRSIGSLKPEQSFEVILFYSKVQQDRIVADAFSGSLVAATEPTKKRFFDWLNSKAPEGGSDPLPAIRRGLSLKPEVMFIFSDGLFEDAAAAEREIRSLNKTNTKLYTLVFDELLLGDTSQLPRETDGVRTLRRIAEQNGGRVKIVTGADLGPR